METKNLFLGLACLAMCSATMAFQGGPKTPPPPKQPGNGCIKQIKVIVPGENRQYVIKQLGNEWVSGCLGDPGECSLVIWVPC